MQNALSRAGRRWALIGRYEDMPILKRADSGEPCDLAAVPRFDAAMLGWSSFSHIRSSRMRSATLRAFADVTDGPVIASFFSGGLGRSRGTRSSSFSARWGAAPTGIPSPRTSATTI
jgi:hypothetical protein